VFCKTPIGKDAEKTSLKKTTVEIGNMLGEKSSTQRRRLLLKRKRAGYTATGKRKVHASSKAKESQKKEGHRAS